MKKILQNRTFQIVCAAILVLSVVTVLFFKLNKKNAVIEIDPKYAEFVSSVTSGVISVESTIKVILVSPFEGDSAIKVKLLDGLFSFSPGVKGHAVWKDSYTLEFIPSEKLEQGTIYQVSFQLDRVAKVPSDMKVFMFSFQTIKQDFEVKHEQLRTYSADPNYYFIEGFVTTADVADNQDVESVISAIEDNVSLAVKWHHSSDRLQHSFRVDSIKRSEVENKMMLAWDGSKIGVDKKDAENIEIPSLSDFKVLDAILHNDSSQYLVVYFSDPLSSNQNLNGLVNLDDVRIKLTGEDNVIKVYPEQTLSGQNHALSVSEDIENYNGKRLAKKYSKQFGFSDIKPAIELVGNGNIIPNADSLIFPFKAVNLRAVDVTITKIYSNNIGQFLQDNTLNTDYNLYTVSRPVLKQRINLQNSGITTLGQWHLFSLDLAKLIKPDMGAIYRVKISFKKSYSLYNCDNAQKDDKVNEEPLTDQIQNIEDEEGEENNYYYYEGDYENYWENRDNPCHPAYYNEERFKSRNVLASNIGIIGKVSNQNEVTLIATNITDAMPASGVSLEVFDFQRQSLGKISSGSKGYATLRCKHKPYFVIAKREEEYGYLTFKEGQSLSLSMFDVKGDELQKGLKGFIYGERGVWRPGDSLYFTFILEDKNTQLPAGHPIIFEFTNPRGQMFKKQVKVQNVNGFYTFFTSTPEDAPTGNWLLSVKAGSAVFTKNVKIETIKPNRLAIDINLGKDSMLSGDLNGSIYAKWLHGALASNLKASINISLTNTSTSFSKFPDYTFSDQTVSFKTMEQTIFEGNLNGEGRSVFNYNISLDQNAPGMMKLNLITKVFEEGGNFSIDYYTAKYSPYKYYSGLSLSLAYGYYGWLYTDTVQKIKIATVDYKGRPVARNNVKVELIKLDWEWWWDSSNEEIANYLNSQQSRIVEQKTVSTSASGNGLISFRVDGNQRGCYYLRVTDPDGQQAGMPVYFYNPWYRDYENGQHPEAAAMLVISPDREKYAVGEKAKISFPASKKTRALISIESGSKILKMFWSDAVPNKDSKATVDIDITDDMAPNVFVNVMLLQPYSNTGNDMPLRMYGYAALLVENPETHLYPVIKTPAKVGSEEVLDVKVSEKKGRPMTYTLALVDEGLLNITRYKTPNPWDKFYAREALGINTWDIYNYVFGGVAGKIEQLFAIGGDNELMADKGDKMRNRFTPIVKFLGPFTLKGGGENRHAIKLPKYAGAVRAMVVAANNGAYGCAEKSVIVKDPLMLVTTLPRVLAPSEEVLLPVTIFADETELSTINIEVKTNGLFSVVGENKKVAQIGKPGGKDLFFKLKVKDLTGVGKVKVIANAGKYKADYEIDLNVRNANEKQVKVTNMTLEPGKGWSGNIDWFGMIGSNKASMEVSVCPPIDLSKRLSYLIEYPYGCIEQTTSSVFPQLYLDELIELSAQEKTSTENNIKAAIERLKLFQNSEGAFTYWPGRNEVNDWGSCYAGHFMLEAEQKGYNLPVGMKKSWLQYQSKQARNWPYNDTYLSYYTQAYRLMTLALAGQPEMGAMNRLKESKSLQTQARWMLAYAYALAGQKETAKEMVQNLGYDFKSYRETGLTYGSDYRDVAMVSMVLSYLKDYGKAYPLIEATSKGLSSEYWLSTQETAFGLIAVSRFINGAGKFSDGISCNTNINGKQQNIKTKQKIYKWNIEEKNKSYNITNNGSSVVFVRLAIEGVPVAGADEEMASNLSVSVGYFDLKGNSLDVTTLKQGTDFKAIVKVTNPSSVLGNYQNIALSQIFPSGWEIVNTRLADMDSQSSMPDYQDIRDDRVYSFFGLGSGSSRTFEILLNASYAGHFYLPATHCEAMYNNNIRAQKKGMWVDVEH